MSLGNARVGQDGETPAAPGWVPLGEVDAKRVLQSRGICIPDFSVARSPDEAVEAAVRLGYPVVLKLIAPRLVHKTEEGGVILEVCDSAQVRHSFDLLDQAARRLKIDVRSAGVLIEQMVGPGIEVIVGVRRDPVLGAFLVLGAGGRLAELLGSPAIHTLPVNREIADSMARETKVLSLLRGFRGGLSYDVAALTSLMVKLSDLAMAPDRIVDEIELNPVIVCPEGSGAVAVDAYASRRPESPDEMAEPNLAVTLDPAVRTLIAPDSVAIIGASANPDKFSNWLLRYLLQHGFRGRLYPVNPHAEEICGLVCYPAIDAVPEPVDVACLVVPAQSVAQTVRTCAQHGVRAGIVFASGFREAGSGQLEQAMLEAAREGGMRLCGPNTIGLIRPGDSICLTFSNTVASGFMRDGPVAVISQSGAMGGSLVARLWEEGIGTSFWVSAGNETDLEVADYLLYAAEDEKTHIVAVFLEGVKNGLRFQAAVAQCHAAGKPVIVYKSGASEAGRHAVETHTGKLAGDASLYTAFFRDIGVIEAGELMEVVDAAKGLLLSVLPKGPAIASLSPSGGVGSVVADECAAAKLRMAELGMQTRERLRALIKSGGRAENPVDVGGLAFQKPDVFRDALDILVRDAGVDGILVSLTTIAEKFALPLAERIVSLLPDAGKPVMVVWLGALSQAPEACSLLSKHLPLFWSVRAAVNAMSALVRWQQVRARRTAGTTGEEEYGVPAYSGSER